MTARRLTVGLIHLLVLRSALWSNVAAAQPPGAVAGALGLVASVSCQAAEVPACVSRDVALRTVRLEMRDGWCSGVLTGPRTIRTAAHCFRFGGPLFRVTRADGSALPARFKWVSTFGPPSNPSAIDQAEIRADRDLIGPGRLAVAEPSVEPDRRAVVVAGYPGGGRLRVHAARVSDHYRGGISGPVDHYELSARRWALAGGESGGPTFVTRGCALRLLGTSVGTQGSRSLIQGPWPRAKLRKL